MSKVILDAATRAKLGGLTEPTEFYDEDGGLLAYFMPANSGLGEQPLIVEGPDLDADTCSTSDPERHN